MVGILQAAQNNTSVFVATPNFLFEQIRDTAAMRFAVQKVAIDENFTEKAALIDSQSDRYISVKAQINNASVGVETGREAADKIRELLLDLRTTVAQAGESDEDIEFRASQFDLAFNKINDQADKIGKGFNIVGAINRDDFTPNQVEYRSDLGIRTTLLQGTHIGSDYRIEVNDGTVWIPELGVDLLQQFSQIQGVALKTTTVGNQVISSAASTRNAVTLINHDEKTNNITLQISVDPDADPKTFTGKLKRSGIELMPSWFYDGLSTAEGRSRAQKAIDKAEVLLTLGEGKIAEAEAKVASDSNRIDREFDRLAGEKTNARLKQADDVNKLLIEGQQQVQAMQINLENLSIQQENYVNAFAGFVTSPFTYDLLT
ncbi:MAG: hypothetical protein RIF37_10055 [Rhodospirillaceae bacterium]